jgi:N-acetylneuraminate synthase
VTIEITIAGRKIGAEFPPYIIAEMSGNHNGNIERAFAIMAAAKQAGADAVKLQTYTPDTMTIDHDGRGFVIEDGLWRGRSLYELYRWAQTPWDWHKPLFERGREIGITVFSSAFDSTAVDLLESLETPAYKIASLEIVDLPLIRRVAKTGKPLIISTGAANFEEIEEAVAAARGAGCRELILLHCTSGYPTPAKESNLRTIPHLAGAFDVVLGLSDHTIGTAVPVAAIALGAAVIEKHLTLARADGGPDAAFSLEPDELARMVKDCHTAWEALGRISYDIAPSEASTYLCRRSLYAVADITEGAILSERNVRSIRPGFGLPPKYLPDILGKSARRTIKRGTPLTWDDIAIERLISAKIE